VRERRPEFEIDLGFFDHIAERIATAVIVLAASYFVGHLLWAWHTGAIERLVAR